MTEFYKGGRGGWFRDRGHSAGFFHTCDRFPGGVVGKSWWTAETLSELYRKNAMRKLILVAVCPIKRDREYTHECPGWWWTGTIHGLSGKLGKAIY